MQCFLTCRARTLSALLLGTWGSDELARAEAAPAEAYLPVAARAMWYKAEFWKGVLVLSARLLGRRKRDASPSPP